MAGLIWTGAGFLQGGVLGAVICGALAAMIALAFWWPPLRNWLGIPPRGEKELPTRTGIRTRDSAQVTTTRGGIRNQDVAIDASDESHVDTEDTEIG